MRISAVINTRNEERNIQRCLSHINPFVDEIVVVDMNSTDGTVTSASRFTDKIWQHEDVGYVEPARNFAISKAQGEWILLVDADEVVPETLGKKLRALAADNYSFYRIPRRNFIFGKWLRHSGWWPDFQIRYFRKEAIRWNDEIHSLPLTQGQGHDLPADEAHAFLHYHYETVSDFLERLNRYTTQEAKQLVADGYVFSRRSLLGKPAHEFFTRFFAWEGYRDGLHGLALSLLQAVSFFTVELKVWEAEKFAETRTHVLNETAEAVGSATHDFRYWYFLSLSRNSHGLRKWIYKIRSTLRI